MLIFFFKYPLLKERKKSLLRRKGFSLLILFRTVALNYPFKCFALPSPTLSHFYLLLDSLNSATLGSKAKPRVSISTTRDSFFPNEYIFAKCKIAFISSKLTAGIPSKWCFNLDGKHKYCMPFYFCTADLETINFKYC